MVVDAAIQLRAEAEVIPGGDCLRLIAEDLRPDPTRTWPVAMSWNETAGSRCFAPPCA